MTKTAVARAKSTDVEEFNPQKARNIDAQADAVIEYARRVKDWPALEQAVDVKMEQQAEFVQWWKDNVTIRHGAGRGNKNNAEHGSFSKDRAEEISGITQQQVSKWSRRLADPEKYRAAIYGAAYRKAIEEITHTTASKWTGDPESYTPKQYIQSAYDVMGGIDLDPASNATAQQVVKAGAYFTEADNGLSKEWLGSVFLNPPYSYPLVAQFIEKLCAECKVGVTEAILLTNNNTDTKWWHQAAAASQAVCFTAGRINFYKEDGSVTQPTNGQNFFYFGPDVDLFAKVFSKHGFVMVKHAA